MRIIKAGAPDMNLTGFKAQRFRSGTPAGHRLSGGKNFRQIWHLKWFLRADYGVALLSLRFKSKGYAIDRCGTLVWPMDLAQYSVRDFDRGVSRLKDALWCLSRCCFFQTPWPWPSTLRVWLLRLFGARVGRGVVIRAGVNISFPWRLNIGDHVWIGEGVSILSLALVTIESNVCVSQRAFLCTGTHNYRLATFDLQTKPITLRSGSWVAAQAFIAPGVEIGSGSVVAAGSVVTENVAPGMLVRGNPAAVVRNIA
jgi:putative colanic acid biosynthesis acetyltransferase WcaF